MIGLMPQEFNFNPHEPNIEILINQAGYFGIPRKDAKIQADVLLKKMELWDRRIRCCSIIIWRYEKKINACKGVNASTNNFDTG